VGAHIIVIYHIYIHIGTNRRANENIKHTIYALFYLYNIRSYTHPRRTTTSRRPRDLRRLLPDNRILCAWSGTDCGSGEYTQDTRAYSRVYKAREWYCCRYMYIDRSLCAMCVYMTHVCGTSPPISGRDPPTGAAKKKKKSRDLRRNANDMKKKTGEKSFTN